MGKYLKKFETHTQYEAFTATTEFIKPNVSICIDTPSEVHYNPLRCEETSEYEVIGEPSYPSEIEGDATSFEMTVNYQRTDTNIYCQETVTEGTDTVTVEIGQNPSTSSTRTVTGTVDYYGNEIEYSVTQSKMVYKVTAKFNVTDTSNRTRIANDTGSLSSIEIDGEQTSVTTGYTFDTTGEHTIKYVLRGAAIGDQTFIQCSGITSCTIGNGVTSIGSSVFSQCSGLTSIDIPSGVTSIGSDAFAYCSSLTSIEIPDSVTSIGMSAFRYCSGLTSITIPDSVTSIGSSVFANCSGLTSVTIGTGLTSINDYTFSGCSSLTSIDIPDSVTNIGGQAFMSCSGLTSITIPDSVTSIGVQAFAYCSSLTSIEIPDSVTSIGSSVFEVCIRLTSITIPDSVTSINYGAFIGCTSLTSIEIPDSVTSISDYAFQGCTSLTSIVSNAMTAPTIQSCTFQYVKTSGTLTVPSGSSGYDVWMGAGNYYLGKYNWTKVEQ